MLYAVLSLVGRVIRLQGHAVVAHAIGGVLAEARVTGTGDLSVLRSPIEIDRILSHIFPSTDIL